MSDPRTSLKLLALVACATAAAAVVGTGGCSNKSTASSPGPVVSPTPIPSTSPLPSPSPTPTANVFVSMAYASMSPTIDPTYGQVDGYAQVGAPPSPAATPSSSPTQTPGPSGIVTVHCNANIQFLNFDVAFHTASVLTPDAGGPFPKFFNNANGQNASVPLTSLSTQSFSTGTVGGVSTVPGRSDVYFTGLTSGTYYIGDFYDYNNTATPSMRTVINVLCP